MILNSLVSHGQAFKWECPKFTQFRVSVPMTQLYTPCFKLFTQWMQLWIFMADDEHYFLWKLLEDFLVIRGPAENPQQWFFFFLLKCFGLIKNKQNTNKFSSVELCTCMNIVRIQILFAWVLFVWSVHSSGRPCVCFEWTPQSNICTA